MSIRVRGTITIQRKTSSRGAFNVGDLVTEIGEFEVKDSLIEEFEPGKYSGDFLIKWIAPDSFSWRGRVFVKNRATLDEILIDDADEGAPAPAAPPEPDPIEQQPTAATAALASSATAAAAAKPAVQSNLSEQGQHVGSAPKSSPRDTSPADADLVLFGREIHELVATKAEVKLDPTVDREQFRRQRDRLKVIGYSFDAKSQSWSCRDAQPA